MRRTLSTALVLVSAVLLTAASPAAERKSFPDVIQLPKGFQPEGIEVGRDTTFYVGSVATGAIYRGDLQTGKGATLVPGASGKSATGIELDSRNRLWVAGGLTRKARVYDAGTGALIRTYTFLPGDRAFINDVVVTRTAAWFTDSRNDVIYRILIGPRGRLGDLGVGNLSGDYSSAGGFNLNGIDATTNGKTLILVQTNKGKLFRLKSGALVAREISLHGERVRNGDGILLDGNMLYVVQNRLNRVAVIKLSADLSSGKVVKRLSDPDLAVPTTIDDYGERLYAVNARFGTPNPGTAAYQVVQLRKPAKK